VYNAVVIVWVTRVGSGASRQNMQSGVSGSPGLEPRSGAPVWSPGLEPRADAPSRCPGLEPRADAPVWSPEPMPRSGAPVWSPSRRRAGLQPSGPDTGTVPAPSVTATLAGPGPLSASTA